MRHETTLGQLLVGSAASRKSVATRRMRKRRRGARLWTLYLILACTLVTLALYGAQALAAQVTPRRIVLRGCWLTEAHAVLDALGYDDELTIAALKHRCAGLDHSGLRWLREIDVKHVDLRTVLLAVEERHPLLLLEVDTAKYWLCDDGYAVPCASDADRGETFERIRNLPLVRTQLIREDRAVPHADSLLLTAACCTELLPGVISAIEVDGQGRLYLFDRHGFRIFLGEPQNLPEKIGALPKALRICEENRGQLEYLDASSPHVFYEKWQEPIS